MDPISEILRAHIEIGKRQLSYILDGVAFGPDLGRVATDEAALREQIADQEAALARHEARNA